MRPYELAPTVLAVALAAGATIVSTAARAGEPPAPSDPARGAVTKVFPIRAVDPRALASVLEMYPGAARPQPELGVVAWTGPADQLAAVEATVRSLDQAPPAARNVVLTAWLVELPGDEAAGTDLPAPVHAAIARLADGRPAHRARLLDRAVLRVRDDGHGTEVRGQFSGPAPSVGSYTLRVRNVGLAPTAAIETVRLDGLTLQFEVVAASPPGSGEPRTASSGSLATDVDLPLGGTAAIGAAALTSPGRSLMLVLRAASAE